MLPELWLLIFDYCIGCPIQFVCKAWYHLHGYNKTYYRCLTTAKLCEWAKPGPKITHSAAYRGHIEVLNWARQQGYEIESAWRYAAMGGRLDVIKMMKSVPEDIVDVAASYGPVELLKWSLEKFPRSNLSWEGAVCFGHWDIVEYLTQHGYKSSWLAVYYLHMGYLDKMKLLAPDEWLNPSTLDKVVSYGNLELLKWISTQLELSSRLKRVIANRAAEHGHLHILEWINVLPTLDFAIIGGIDILKWCLSRGIRYVENPCFIAVCLKSLSVLKFMVDGGCLFNLQECLYQACAQGSLEMAEWLISIGADWGKPPHRFLSVISCNDIQLLKWAVAKGFVIPENAIKTALKYNMYRIVRYLKTI